MFHIKRLYSFILGTFLPLLLATFSFCLFVLLMQFLWKYVNDMVGKGVEMKVLVQMFFYAANSLVPMTLPLAILLASLMAFGNLGEHFELLAMKASGISLIRIMKPLIMLIIVICVFAFFFQNTILPPAQVKLWTIVSSLRQNSPELEIPEGSFYKGIPGYNVYVQKKDKDGLLRNMTIYDYSKGFNKVEVTVADSGRLHISDDKKFLILSLYNGESFGNANMRESAYNQEHIPYLRETFSRRNVLIEFDSNFNMADESIMQNRYISKNMHELHTFVDSVGVENDSVSRELAPMFVKQIYSLTFSREGVHSAGSQIDTIQTKDFKSFYENAAFAQKLAALENAKSRTDRVENDYRWKMGQQSDVLRQIREHQVEYHRRFTLSLACILFFFIGASLGAIIRKGGLGLPAVISVFLFILYYIVDTFGLKLARQGVWQVWEGMWMSTALLASLGVFFTYKAVNDSVITSPDAWRDALLRFIGKRELRNYSRKEVIMTPPDYQKDILMTENWDMEANLYVDKNQKLPFYLTFWQQDLRDRQLKHLIASMNHWIEDLQNADENLIIGKLMDYPVINPLNLNFLNKSTPRWTCAVLFPFGIIIYTLYAFKQKQINNDLKIAIKVNDELRKAIVNISKNNL
ncbi:MAG: LptF/LptG family permease [Dysgonamonadaceae bacterium]|nr:LptF/LptG family permease [Dysgonamonadaceae bacterium]